MGRIVVFGVCVVLVIFSFLYLTVAAKRGLVWIFLVFFVPISRLVLICLEREALRIFCWELGVIAIGLWGLYGMDVRPENDSFYGRLDVIMNWAPEAAPPPPAPIVRPSIVKDASLETRKQRLREWRLSLEAKRAALNARDPFQKAIYERELADYTAELNKVKAEMLK